MTTGTRCVFCLVPPERILSTSEHGLAMRDAYPVSPGHSLIIPKRHVRSIYDLSEAEQLDLWRLVGRVREGVQTEFCPDGYTIGINDGAAAGQTVDHGHIHVIPRYAGDVPDPRGGVRWVVPAKAQYWV